MPNEGLVSLTIKATLTKGDFSSTKEFIIYIGVGTYTGYYQSINGLQGSTLKDELKRIISKMKTISYSNTSYILDDSDADQIVKGKSFSFMIVALSQEYGMAAILGIRNIYGPNQN